MTTIDKRTPEDIALARLAYLLGLPGHDLCATDKNRTGPQHPPHPPCEQQDIGDGGVILLCALPAEWRVSRPRLGVGLFCTEHAARIIRARLWLQRLRLQRK